MVQFERVMVVSCSLSNVTVVPSLTIRSHFDQMSLTLKSTGVGQFGANFRRKGQTDVSHIFTQSGRDMGLSYAKEIMLISSAI